MTLSWWIENWVAKLCIPSNLQQFTLMTIFPKLHRPNHIFSRISTFLSLYGETVSISTSTNRKFSEIAKIDLWRDDDGNWCLVLKIDELMGVLSCIALCCLWVARIDCCAELKGVDYVLLELKEEQCWFDELMGWELSCIVVLSLSCKNWLVQSWWWKLTHCY